MLRQTKPACQRNIDLYSALMSNMLHKRCMVEDPISFNDLNAWMSERLQTNEIGTGLSQWLHARSTMRNILIDEFTIDFTLKLS